jgi:hypothetical protein
MFFYQFFKNKQLVTVVGRNGDCLSHRDLIKKNTILIKEKKMFRIAQISIVLFIFGFTLFYCSNNDQGRRRFSPQEMAKQLQEELSLTEKQTQQVEQIYVESQEEMAKIRENLGGDRNKVREMMIENREKVDQRIQEILTDEQKTKFEQYRQERDSRMRERGHERRDRD